MLNPHETKIIITIGTVLGLAGAVALALGFAVAAALFSPEAQGSTAQQAESMEPVSQEQVDREVLHRLVFAVQIYVDGLADRVLYFTEDYSVVVVEQRELDWSAKQALWRLRELNAVGDLHIQTPCGVGK